MNSGDILSRLNGAATEVRTLAIVWPLVWTFKLPAGATIVVAGAYRGNVMDLLAHAYPLHSRLIGFEPQGDALCEASHRLAKWPNVELHEYAIGVEDGVFPMGEYGAEYAGFQNLNPADSRTGSGGIGIGDMRDVVSVFRDLHLRQIDLLLLNMEGYEYKLVPYLVEHGYFVDGRIRRLVVQVHKDMPGNVGIESDLGMALDTIERTHKRVYDELPQWGLWQWSGA